jgi:hypothetical protein
MHPQANALFDTSFCEFGIENIDVIWKFYCCGHLVNSLQINNQSMFLSFSSSEEMKNFHNFENE